MSIELVTKFMPYVDEIFTAESKKSMLTNTDFDFAGAKSVKVYKISTSPMHDYGRQGPESGNWSRYGPVADLEAPTEVMTLTRDRSFTFAIDKLDTDETAQQLAAASALARQLRQVVIPEVDAYTYNVMCEKAGHKPAAIVLTNENIYTEILKANEALDNAEVPESGRFILVTPEVNVLMKHCKDITMDTDIGNEMRLKGVIGLVDGAAVVKLPKSRVPAGFGFMVGHPCATVAPTKLEDYTVHANPPGISGALVEGRTAYDAFVLDNKACALYFQAKAADGLTVTSEEGSASGKTKVTVSPAIGSGNSYVYKAASAVDLPAVGEECKTGFTAWDGSADITAATGAELLIVEVDADKKAVKAGTAKVTAKA